MLKITVQNSPDAPRLVLDGKLAGEWVRVLRREWETMASENPAPKVTLDLSGVTFVDEEGKKLLSSMLKRGAELTEPRVLLKYVVDELRAGL